MMHYKELGGGLLKITSDHRVQDTRTMLVYSEVVDSVNNRNYYIETE